MKDDRLYLHHMLERCHRITRFAGPGKVAFIESEALQDAVIRNVEVIGETAKRVSAETRVRLAELDWKTICGMRDVLIHDYIGVDLEACGINHLARDDTGRIVAKRLRIPLALPRLSSRFPMGDGAGWFVGEFRLWDDKGSDHDTAHQAPSVEGARHAL